MCEGLLTGGQQGQTDRQNKTQHSAAICYRGDLDTAAQDKTKLTAGPRTVTNGHGSCHSGPIHWPHPLEGGNRQGGDANK